MSKRKEARNHLKQGETLRAKLTHTEIEELIFLLEKYTETSEDSFEDGMRKELIQTLKKKLHYSRGNSAKWTYLQDTFTK